MQKRGLLSIFSIIIILILIPNAYSIYEELVYSGTVEDRDVVNISNHIFEFRIDPVSSKVFIEIDISGVIVSSGECKIKDGFDICISNVSLSYRNYTGYYDVYKALLKVYQIKSTLDLTNTIEKNNLLIDEEATAELALENAADVVAENVTATIEIPSSVLVTDVEGCKKTLGNIIFKGDVHPTQIRKCIYKLQGLVADDFELTANATYFDGIEKQSTASNIISGKVYNYSLQITSKLNKSKFNIQEKFDFAIDIKNINDQYDLRITTLSIKIPEGLLLLKRPRDTTGNNRLISWSGTLEAGEKKSLVAQFQSQITGNHSIPIRASYEIGKFLRITQNPFNIEVYCDCPYLYHDFSQQIAVPDQRVTLKVFLSNPSSVHSFKNVKLDYTTNIPNIQSYSTAYSKINPSETIKIFDSPIITPPLDEIYHFNITSIYESNNQVFIIKDNIIIKVPGGEEIPIVEEKTEVEEQQETEEHQKAEEVDLGAEKSEEESEEEKTEEPGEEIPVTTIEYKEERPIKPYTIIAYIAAIIFIFIVLVIFKRKRAEAAEEKKDIKEVSSASEKKQIIKESLSNIFRGIKEKIKRKPQDTKKEEIGYKELEKEIQDLGKISKKK